MAFRRIAILALAVAGAACGIDATPADADSEQTDVAASPEALSATTRFTRRVRRVDIVSDQAGALTLDTTLVNAWGLAFSPTGIAWVSSNEEGLAEIYDVHGTKVAPAVTVPPPPGATGPSAPTGMVLNLDDAAFGGDRFIISTEDGTIAGWKASSGGTAVIRVDNSAGGAIYKGVTVGSYAGQMRVFAADFHNGRVDVFDEAYAPISTGGGFQDCHIPEGYAPFNVQEEGGALIVTYAKQDADAEDDVAGPGFGFVDLFDTDGNLVTRLVSRGALNSPWGVEMTPLDFGSLSRRLLIGNFGDGRINVYRLDDESGHLRARHEGQLRDVRGGPLAIDGLWALRFGAGARGSDTHVLYFTAGPDHEAHGVFGALRFEQR